MKKTGLSRTISVLSLIFFTCSCGTKSGPGPTQNSIRSITMKIDGVAWKATKRISASVSFVSEDGNTDGVTISGYNGNQMFQITTGHEISGTGIYLVPSAKGGGFFFQHNDKTYVEILLTVVIQEMQIKGSVKYVKGTFHGTAKNVVDETDEIKITDGRFDSIGH